MDGSELRQRRLALDMSQSQLAGALGVSKNTVARWERGELAIGKPLMVEAVIANLEREGLAVKRQQQRIEQIAMTIRDNLIDQADLLALDGKTTETEARRINEETGWGYDVRWVDAEYIDERSFTRVEDDHLNDADLAEAIRLAQEGG